MQAKAYARIGDREACHAQMHLAEASAAQVVQDNEPAETGYIRPGNTKIKQAEALLRLGDTAAARSYAFGAIGDSATMNTRARVHSMATLSMALTARGEIEESAAYGHLALDEAAGMESWRIREHLINMIGVLEPFRDTRTARELIDHAGDVLSLPL